MMPVKHDNVRKGTEHQKKTSEEQKLWDEAQRINQRLAGVKWEAFENLEGKPITIVQATIRYHISPATLRKWLYKGLIREINRGKRGVKYLNERDVAYLAKLYQIRSEEHTLSGRPLARREGDRLYPYLLKHPTLSVYRRRAKKETA